MWKKGDRVISNENRLTGGGDGGGRAVSVWGRWRREAFKTKEDLTSAAQSACTAKGVERPHDDGLGAQGADGAVAGVRLGAEDGASGSRALRFVERFDDLFGFGLLPAMAFGLLLAWAWMGLAEGYPVFMDGAVDLLSVLLLLGSFAGSLLAAALLSACRALLCRPVGWLVTAFAMAAAALSMLVASSLWGSFADAGTLVLVRCLMVVVGAGTAVLLLCCVTVFCRLRPPSAAVAFAVASSITFVSYFCIVSCERHIGAALFCLLPVAAAACLLRESGTIVERLAAREGRGESLGSGYVSMCLSFGVFFFAIGVKCAFEPMAEFAEGADTSVIALVIASFVLLYLVALGRRPLEVVAVLGVFYGVAVMVLTVCIALAPLSLDPVASVVYNADVLVVMMVFWLLVSFVAHLDEAHVLKVAGIALATAALGMMAGWLLGDVVHAALAHDRSYFAIAIACATAAFSTIGFSSKSFPALTRRGQQEAQRMRAGGIACTPEEYGQRIAKAHQLSEREAEVLRLLAAGYGAQDVAEKLVISYHTARTHVRNIYRKMDVHSQRELLDLFEAAKQG